MWTVSPPLESNDESIYLRINSILEFHRYFLEFFDKEKVFSSMQDLFPKNAMEFNPDKIVMQGGGMPTSKSR